MLYFIYFYCYLSSRIDHDLVYEQRCLDRDRSFVTFTSSIRLCSVLCFKAPEWFSICWQIASHSYMSLYMAFSRKYGTVWYHPASSKLWHLTALPFVNFRKNWLARFGISSCVKPACSACCVLGAGCGFCINRMYLYIVGGLCLLVAVHVHLHRRFLMNDDEGVGNAPCTFCSVWIPDRGTCKRSFTDLIFVTILMSGLHYLPWTSLVEYAWNYEFLGEILNMN
jgi:hypothetical protein